MNNVTDLATPQTPSSKITTILEARQLVKQIRAQQGDLTILSGLDLEVNRGESVAILGASGAGKSTLLGILAGLDSASSGEVLLDGQSLSDLDEDQRAKVRSRSVGFVFQNFQLLPALTDRKSVV